MQIKCNWCDSVFDEDYIEVDTILDDVDKRELIQKGEAQCPVCHDYLTNIDNKKWYSVNFSIKGHIDIESINHDLSMSECQEILNTKKQDIENILETGIVIEILESIRG